MRWTCSTVSKLLYFLSCWRGVRDLKMPVLVNSSLLSLRQAMWNVAQSSVLLGHVKTQYLSLSSVVLDAQVQSFSKHLVSSWNKFLFVSSKPPVLCDVLCADEPRIPAGLRASVKSCRYNGSIYQPGETFTKHDLFPSKQSNQCVMCTCSVSLISFTTFCFTAFLLILWKVSYPKCMKHVRYLKTITSTLI